MQPIPILLYHSVSEDFAPAYRRWRVTPHEFAAQMGILAQRGYQPITVGDFARQRRTGRALPPRTCIITFDDGLRDFAEGAMPVLARYGFHATLFVVSGMVGATSRWLTVLGEGRRPMLDWPTLRDLNKVGIEIGAHTVSHPELDTISRRRAKCEIQDSKHALEDGLGQVVTTFAYPHGYASKTTRTLVEDAGYLAACRVRHAISADTEDLFALSRIVVTSDVSPAELVDVIEKPSLPIAPPTDRIVAIGWRAVRRARALHHSLARTPMWGRPEGGK